MPTQVVAPWRGVRMQVQTSWPRRVLMRASSFMLRSSMAATSRHYAAREQDGVTQSPCGVLELLDVAQPRSAVMTDLSFGPQQGETRQRQGQCGEGRRRDAGPSSISSVRSHDAWTDAVSAPTPCRVRGRW